MSDWSDGYMAEIDYTFGYYPELNPSHHRLAFLNAGIASPEISLACELGFGQGISVNIHGAASGARWWGTDFNPSQAGLARELADAAQSGAVLGDESFGEFAARPDIPEFDYIALHGIWSWVSDENRGIIVEFIRRKLKVGGLLYISYNVDVGFAAFRPLRDLMAQHASVMGADGVGITHRIDAAIEFSERLLATNPIYARANPLISDRLKLIKSQGRSYLAHEYFNRSWQPMSFTGVAEWLGPAKTQFVCSANYLDHVDAINLTAEQQALLNAIPDQALRETARDMIVNQQFRRDYWVRGRRRMPELDRIKALQDHRVVLVSQPSDIALKVTAALGEANLNEAVYKPMLDLLADHRPRSLGQIETALQGAGLSLAQIVQAALVLGGGGHLMTAQADSVISRTAKASTRLNARIAAISRSEAQITHLASPVTGGAVAVDRVQQLFLLAIASGRRQPAEWAQFAWASLEARGHRLLDEGKVIEDPAENIAKLTAQATTFATGRLPILKALQVSV